MTFYLFIFTLIMSLLISAPIVSFGKTLWVFSAFLFFNLFYFVFIRHNHKTMNIYNVEFFRNEIICLKSIMLLPILAVFYLIDGFVIFEEVRIFTSLFFGLYFSGILSIGYRYKLFFRSCESETWNALRKLLKAYQAYHGIVPP